MAVGWLRYKAAEMGNWIFLDAKSIGIGKGNWIFGTLWYEILPKISLHKEENNFFPVLNEGTSCF